MDINSLVRAINKRDRLSRLLEPDRYVSLDTMRDEWVEAFPPRPAPPMPGDPMPEPGSGPVMPGPEIEQRARVIAGLMKGEQVPDGLMKELFGFGYAEFAGALRAADPVKKPIPDKCVLMTFDDATLDHYTVACPELEKYGGKANLFVAECAGGFFGGNGFWDKSLYMTWEQIRELSDRGHEVLNHSLNHLNEFRSLDRNGKLAEIRGIEERCAQYGIPRPTVFGAPGGGYTPEILDLMRETGYHWGRGDLYGVSPKRLGDALYDPYVDTPLCVPHSDPESTDDLRAELARCTGKVMVLVFHGIDDPMMTKIPFADIVRTIYEEGGRCITFRELEEYVDPVKADAYTR